MSSSNFKGVYKNGNPDGYWEVYHDNGQLHFKGTYRNREEVGYWIIYDMNGQLTLKEYFYK